MKRFLSCLIALMLVMSCFAFASAEGDVTTIRLAWWGGQARADLTLEAIKLFMEKNPDIKVETDFADWGGYWSKLATQAAGGTLPDVIQMDYAYMTQYANNGILADLTPYMESGALNLENIAMDSLSSGKVNGTVYALPTGTNALLLAYRKDVLEQAGLTMPMEPTLDEYIEICKKVYETTGRTTNIDWGNFGNTIRSFGRDYGGHLYNEDFTALGFDAKKVLTAVLNDLADSMEHGYQIEIGTYTGTSLYDQFISDTWSFTIFSNQVAACADTSACELEVVMMPTMADATAPSTYFKPNMLWAVSEQSKEKEAAMRLINFLNHDPEAFDIMGLDRGLPLSSAIQEHLAKNMSEADKKVVAFMDYIGQEGKTSPIDVPDPTAHGDVVNLWSQIIEEVRYGVVTRDGFDARVDQFIEEANAILQKAVAAQ